MSTPHDAGSSSSLTRPVRGRKQTALLPLTSLVLGLVALLGLSWIPVVNVLALLVAPLAVVLGFRGRRRLAAEHRVMSWYGMITGGLAIVVSIAMLAAFMTTENGARS